MKKVFSLLFFLFIGCLWGLFTWGNEDFFLGKNLDQKNLEFSIIFTDRNNQEIYRTFDKENREWESFSKMPETLKKATLLAEDRRFYYHFGVDFIGIMRASVRNIEAGKIVQGASTITQQVARKVFLTDQQTFKRKLREMFIALGIEHTYSKDEIFEMYLNTVPYGARINGVKVAAQYYFKKTPENLSDAECLILALLPKNPVLLSRKTEIKDWLGHCKKSDTTTNCSPFDQPDYQKSRLENLLFRLAQKENWASEKTKKV